MFHECHLVITSQCTRLLGRGQRETEEAESKNMEGRRRKQTKTNCILFMAEEGPRKLVQETNLMEYRGGWQDQILARMLETPCPDIPACCERLWK
jgi:hypothetical protein